MSIGTGGNQKSVAWRSPVLASSPRLWQSFAKFIASPLELDVHWIVHYLLLVISPYGYWIVHIRYWIRIYMQRICQINVQLLWKPVSVIPTLHNQIVCMFFWGWTTKKHMFWSWFWKRNDTMVFQAELQQHWPSLKLRAAAVSNQYTYVLWLFPNEGWLHFWGLSFQSLMINSIFWRLTSPFLTLESLATQCLKIKSSWLWLPILEPQMLNCFGRWFLRFD